MATVEEIGQNARNFVDEINNPDLDENQLREILSTFNESSQWDDYVDSVSFEQAILCWKVVERIRLLSGRLPNNLRI